MAAPTALLALRPLLLFTRLPPRPPYRPPTRPVHCLRHCAVGAAAQACPLARPSRRQAKVHHPVQAGEHDTHKCNDAEPKGGAAESVRARRRLAPPLAAAGAALLGHVARVRVLVAAAQADRARVLVGARVLVRGRRLEVLRLLLACPRRVDGLVRGWCCGVQRGGGLWSCCAAAAAALLLLHLRPLPSAAAAAAFLLLPLLRLDSNSGCAGNAGGVGMAAGCRNAAQLDRQIGCPAHGGAHAFGAVRGDSVFTCTRHFTPASTRSVKNKLLAVSEVVEQNACVAGCFAVCVLSENAAAGARRSGQLCQPGCHTPPRS